MNIEELIHPEDAKALKALKSIPTLPTVMEKIFQYGYDEMSWSENVTRGRHFNCVKAKTIEV